MVVYIIKIFSVVGMEWVILNGVVVVGVIFW